MINKLERMIRAVITRGVLTATQIAKMQTISGQSQVGRDVAEVEHFEPYGFTSNPKPGAEPIFANLNGTDQTVAIVIADRRYRITSLAPGEVALYDDNGSSVELRSTGIVVNAVGNATVNASGDAIVDGARVLLGTATGLPTEKVITGTEAQATAAGLVAADHVYAKAVGP